MSQTGLTGFQFFLQYNETNHIGDYICLTVQSILTIQITKNIFKNWQKFPIKQLSPLCTLCALYCFLLINVLSFIGKWIEQAGNYFDINGCAQCRLYDKPALIAIGVIYMGLRQLPFILFFIKTLRVCICFVSKQYSQVNWLIAKIFSQEKIMIIISLIYTALVIGLNTLQVTLIHPLTPQSGYFTFEYLCPKNSSAIDWIITINRYLMLCIIYYYSIKSYKQLDFKRFIFFICLLDNTQVVVRLSIAAFSIDKHTYHQFYYHSLLLHLVGTLILYPYSKYNEYVNPPPQEAILQNFETFINYAPGLKIIESYADYLDKKGQTKKYSQCFIAYRTLVEIRKQTFLVSKNILKYLSLVEEIIHSEDLEVKIQNLIDLNKKIADKTLRSNDLIKMENQFKDICNNQIYREWKKTQSRFYVSKQFRDNISIDNKMRLFNIEI